MGTVFEYQGQYGAAVNAKEEALKAFRDLKEQGFWLGEVLSGTGHALAMAGRFDDARRLLAGIHSGSGWPAGASGEPGAARPRRFTVTAAVSLIEGAGLRAGSVHGVRVFADLVPGVFADADPGAADALAALEQAASAHPAFHDIATQFHIVGYR